MVVVVVVVVVVECGGGENKIKKVISTKCILFTIIFNNNICITTKLYNKFMYNHIHFIFKKHIQVYVQLFTVLFKQYPHILAPG